MIYKKIFIDGKETSYSVSDEGFIRNDKNNFISNGVLNNCGYRIFKINNRTYLVHRLVATYFVENDEPDFKKEIDHIDGNKDNNKATNLRWCTRSENLLFKNGKKIGAPLGNSNACNRKNRNKKYIRYIYTVNKTDYEFKDLTKLLNCSPSCITEAFRKRSKNNKVMIKNILIERREVK